MTSDIPNRTTPVPRVPIADDNLSRPDWTLTTRHTEGVIALDKNETADPVFREQLAGILSTLPVRAVTEYPECAPYYHLLAGHLGVSAKNLLFTPGSDGAIRSVFEAFLSPGDTVLMTAPSFAMYAVYSKIAGAEAIDVTYEASDSGPMLSVETVCRAIGEHRPRLFCLPNPDSPTGTIFPARDLENIIRAAADVGTVILIDEAYFPFSNITALGLIDAYPNLVVTRTFAKAWGLAGLRLGFAAAHPDMATILHKVRPMYEVNGFALAAMEKLLGHEDWITASVGRINDGKQYFIERMKGKGLRTLGGAGNFLHVDFADSRDAVQAALEGKVLYKRAFAEPCLEGFSRFSAAPKEIMASVANIIDGALA